MISCVSNIEAVEVLIVYEKKDLKLRRHLSILLEISTISGLIDKLREKMDRYINIYF